MDAIKLVIAITLCVMLVIVTVCFTAWFVNGGDTVSVSTIEELIIETDEASVHLKGMRTEVNNLQLNRFLEVLRSLGK